MEKASETDQINQICYDELVTDRVPAWWLAKRDPWGGSRGWMRQFALFGISHIDWLLSIHHIHQLTTPTPPYPFILFGSLRSYTWPVTQRTCVCPITTSPNNWENDSSMVLSTIFWMLSWTITFSMGHTGTTSARRGSRRTTPTSTCCSMRIWRPTYWKSWGNWARFWVWKSTMTRCWSESYGVLPFIILWFLMLLPWVNYFLCKFVRLYP